MPDTLKLPGDMPTIAALIGESPELVSASLTPASLALPELLYDPATPPGPASPVDAIAPLVVRRIGDTFEIIDGCKRARRADTTNPHPAIVLALPQSGEEAGVPAGLLRLALNRGRALHLRERIRFCCWLHANVPDSVRDAVAREVGISSHDLRLTSPLVTASSEALEAVASARIDLQHAGDFLRLSPADQSAFLRTFAGLDLSMQMQREFLEWLPEVATARGCSAGDVLMTVQPHHDVLNAPQRIAAVREALFEMRFPSFHTARKEWLALAGRVNPDRARVRLAPTPAFEEDRLDVTVTIRSGEEGSRIFGALAGIPGEIWQHLVSPIDAGGVQKPFYVRPGNESPAAGA